MLLTDEAGCVQLPVWSGTLNMDGAAASFQFPFHLQDDAQL